MKYGKNKCDDMVVHFVRKDNGAVIYPTPHENCPLNCSLLKAQLTKRNAPAINQSRSSALERSGRLSPPGCLPRLRWFFAGKSRFVLTKKKLRALKLDS